MTYDQLFTAFQGELYDTARDGHDHSGERPT